MADYELRLSVDADKVAQFNTQGWKLCFATAVQANGKPNFNVVAFSRAIAENVVIRWTDSYSIAASQDAFSNGIKFEASTKPVDIAFGQKYTQQPTWVTGTVQDDAEAPKAGFRFVNNTEGAAAVIYKKINGVASPIYISQNAPLPPGNEDLTPISKVKVWFSNSAVTQTMISEFQGKPLDIDFTGTKKQAAVYSSTGAWSLAV